MRLLPTLTVAALVAAPALALAAPVRGVVVDEAGAPVAEAAAVVAEVTASTASPRDCSQYAVTATDDARGSGAVTPNDAWVLTDASSSWLPNAGSRSTAAGGWW